MNETIKENSWIPLILVCFATFIIALDTTFMNVSISSVVADLGTDVNTIQTISSFYTLICFIHAVKYQASGYSW